MHSSWLCRQHLGGLSRPRHLPAAFVIEPAIRIRSSFSVAQAERWPMSQELQVKLSGMWVALMLTSVMSSGSEKGEAAVGDVSSPSVAARDCIETPRQQR